LISRRNKKLICAVEIYGNKNLKKCSNFIQTSTPKQCRDKWFDDFQPHLNKAIFEEWVNQIILVQHQIIVNKRGLIAQSLSGRTASSVKNQLYSYLSKCHERKSQSHN
jgi:hypothetical protein